MSWNNRIRLTPKISRRFSTSYHNEERTLCWICWYADASKAIWSLTRHILKEIKSITEKNIPNVHKSKFIPWGHIIGQVELFQQSAIRHSIGTIVIKNSTSFVKKLKNYIKNHNKFHTSFNFGSNSFETFNRGA
jgi:hypothetical protein